MNVDLSVLIIVRNWSTVRLELSLQSLNTARQGTDTEVVLLDYGSDDPFPYEELATRYGAVYHRAEAEVWSRSRAVNVAAGIASGTWLLFADADMLWSPGALRGSLELVQGDPNQFLVFQARDLPPTHNGETLTDRGFSWEELEAVSAWRPRWGMGMQVVHAAKFQEIRGLDERMTIWGAEDADVAQRLRAAGLRQHWVNDDDIRVYHVWHEDSKQAAKTTAKGPDALRRNREILYNDKSVIRNLPLWANSSVGHDPLVSVVIVTRDRQDYLKEAVDSILGQTFQDFEVVVLDDGDEGGVEALLSEYGDTRLKYFKTPSRGVAAGRNFGAKVSRGIYTAIHDDDDIMLPWSLEARLSSIEAGDAGSYGGFWNFDDETGELELVPGKDWSLKAVYSGKVAGHPTMLVRTDIIRRIGYDDSIQAGSDYKFRVQTALGGYRFRHCGDVVTLRRMHTRNMSVVDLSVQRGTSDLVNSVLRFNTAGAERKDLRGRTRDKDFSTHEIPPHLTMPGRVQPWLPTRLVERVGVWRHGDTPAPDILNKLTTVDVGLVLPGETIVYSLISDISAQLAQRLFSVDGGASFSLRANPREAGVDSEPPGELDYALATVSSFEMGTEEAIPSLYSVQGTTEEGLLITSFSAQEAVSSIENDGSTTELLISPSQRGFSITDLLSENEV